MNRKFPALFVSHGAPSMVIEPCPTRSFLVQLGQELGTPAGIVCVSAHWTTAKPRVTLHPHPPTIHDFGGFAEELHHMEYPAPGDPQLGRRVLALLEARGLNGEPDPVRGYDHGAWSPLMLMYPQAEVPLVQLSVQPHRGPEYHLELGRALAPLREEGILILASGSTTHNLADFFGRSLDAAPLHYAREFAEWLKEGVEAGRLEELLAYQERAPQANRNHPTPEHLLPFYVALGTGGAGRQIHDAYTYGALSMAAFRWD
ncbi:dioxygenase [Geomonas limicola]|uniref:Dioxygenase n=1 Tax=Geomonas limicola TaxID=2740186 RepID=A0A6V8NAG2_9BACT|nr:class III extradiol ring-cleavage dioxygenase [Geomonas limicola]GFO69615.1 dioxygenase [Geomonas limicola]